MALVQIFQWTILPPTKNNPDVQFYGIDWGGRLHKGEIIAMFGGAFDKVGHGMLVETTDKKVVQLCGQPRPEFRFLLNSFGVKPGSQVPAVIALVEALRLFAYPPTPVAGPSEPIVHTERCEYLRNQDGTNDTDYSSSYNSGRSRR